MCVCSTILEPTCKVLIPKFIVMDHDRRVTVFEINIDILIPYLPVNTTVVIVAWATAEVVNPISVAILVTLDP